MESFTREQLLGYIKKQKLKIKQLETENETLKVENTKLTANALNVVPPEIKTTPIEENKEVSNPIIVPINPIKTTNTEEPPNSTITESKNYNKLIQILINKSNVQHQQDSIKILFYKWKILHLINKLEKKEKIIGTNKENSNQQEIKINKLKALLARTHHSKQKTLEDTNQLKKAQEEIAVELKGKYYHLYNTYDILYQT